MKTFSFTLFFILALILTASAQIADGSFEAGPGSGNWTEASTNFGTPICDAGCGDCGGPCGPNTGSSYVWFGGANALDTASIEQSLVIPLGTSASIEMMVHIAVAGPGVVEDRLEISVDGTILNTITSHDSTSYGMAYTLSSTDITDLADDNVHTVRIEGFQSTTTSTNILVDDVVLIVDEVTSVLFSEQLAEDGLFLYPNQADEVVNLEFRKIYGDVTISIISLSGAVLSQEKIDHVNGRTLSYDTSNFEEGFYFVNVSNKNGFITKKMVVVH